mgnify:FL=1
MRCRVSDQTSYASAIGAIDILVQFIDEDCDTQGIKKIIYIEFHLLINLSMNKFYQLTF